MYSGDIVAVGLRDPFCLSGLEDISRQGAYDRVIREGCNEPPGRGLRALKSVFSRRRLNQREYLCEISPDADRRRVDQQLHSRHHVVGQGILDQAQGDDPRQVQGQLQPDQVFPRPVLTDTATCCKAAATECNQQQPDFFEE